MARSLLVKRQAFKQILNRQHHPKHKYVFAKQYMFYYKTSKLNSNIKVKYKARKVRDAKGK